MTSLALAALLQTAVLTASPNLNAATETYASAHKVHAETGRPLVVLVGADWCPACVQMKSNVIPQAKQDGVFDEVAFATINTDHDTELAQEMIEGGMIPQLVMYYHTPNGVMRRKLVGAHSPGEIRSFIRNGLAAPVTAMKNIRNN